MSEDLERDKDGPIEVGSEVEIEVHEHHKLPQLPDLSKPRMPVVAPHEKKKPKKSAFTKASDFHRMSSKALDALVDKKLEDSRKGQSTSRSRKINESLQSLS